MRIASAAIVYWAMVFALGFVLGTVRVLWVIPLMAQSPAQWLTGLAAPHALLGLAGQVVFALMPWLIVRRASLR